MVVSVVGGDLGGDRSNYLWRLRHNTALPLVSNSDDAGQGSALPIGDRAPESRPAAAQHVATAHSARRKPVRPPSRNPCSPTIPGNARTTHDRVSEIHGDG